MKITFLCMVFEYIELRELSLVIHRYDLKCNTQKNHPKIQVKKPTTTPHPPPPQKNKKNKKH